MIWLAIPPFSDGNNLSYLYDKLKDFLIAEKEDFADLRSFKEHSKRRGKGFYNFDEWMQIVSLDAENIQKIKSGDTVIFLDFWNPFIQNVFIHCKLNKINAKLIGWFHGSTFLESDLLTKILEDYLNKIRAMEISWFEALDQIWCASDYFTLGVPEKYKHKIIKVPEPFIAKDFGIERTDSSKLIDIIYPFRLDSDKIDIDILIEVIASMIIKYNFCDILITTPSEVPEDYKFLTEYPGVRFKEHITGNEHLETLSEAKVIFSTAMQEGWGYTVLKAVASGCIPLLPNRAVYPELYAPKYIYDSATEAFMKMESFLANYPENVLEKPLEFNFDGYFFNNGLLDKK